LLRVVTPLRAGADGSQQLTISLHPAELGTVQVAVVVRGGETTIRLTPTTEHGAAALRANASVLADQLRDSGEPARIVVDSVAVATSSSSASGDGSNNHDPSPTPSSGLPSDASNGGASGERNSAETQPRGAATAAPVRYAPTTADAAQDSAAPTHTLSPNRIDLRI
jgi:flagellar hook-length control protein FliK